MKTWTKEEIAMKGSLPITREEFKALGLDPDAGNIQGELKTYGPWQIPTSYKALLTSTVYIPKDEARYTAEKESETAYRIGTLSRPRQEGYCLEGRVKLNGKSYRAFTSSALFDVDGKLVSVATIHVCI